MRRFPLLLLPAFLIGAVVGGAMRPHRLAESAEPRVTETRIRKGESDSPKVAIQSVDRPQSRPAFPVEAGPVDPGMKAQDSILDFLLPFHPDDDKLRHAFWTVLYRDRKAQDQLLDLVLQIDEPDLLECAGEFLVWANEPGQLKRIADAYESEASPARRVALVVALGQSALNSVARPHVQSILMGGDESLQAAVLQRMSAGSLLQDSQVADLFIPRIRDLLLAGESIGLRLAAAGALRGDPSKEGQRLLIDRLLHDPSPEVQERCAWSLPLNSDTLSLSWKLIENNGRSLGVRRAAARMLLNGADRKMLSLSPEQKEALTELSRAKENP